MLSILTSATSYHSVSEKILWKIQNGITMCARQADTHTHTHTHTNTRARSHIIFKVRNKWKLGSGSIYKRVSVIWAGSRTFSKNIFKLVSRAQAGIENVCCFFFSLSSRHLPSFTSPTRHPSWTRLRKNLLSTKLRKPSFLTNKVWFSVNQSILAK